MPKLKRLDALLLLAAIAAVIAAALPVLTYPMGRDQGMYANIARSILNGGLPFIDMWDIKPPAIYYIYAAGISLFGPGSAALRAIDLLTVSLTLPALYWLALRLTGRRGAAVLVCVLFPVFYFTETFASLTQSDSVVTLPMTWAVLCAVLAADAPRASRRALIASLLAGALCAATIWFKHYYALFVLALVVEQVLARRALPWKEAGAFALGGMPVGALPLAYFLATGVFDEMLIVAQGTARYNAQAAVSLEAFIGQMRSYVFFRWEHWGLLLIIAASGLLLPGRLGRFMRRPWRVVWLWLLAGLGFVLLQAKGFDTHWIPMLPPLALLGAGALAGWLGVVNSRHLKVLAYGLVALLLFGVLVKDTWLRAWPYLSGTQSQVAYYEAHFQANDLKPWESLRMVRYLQRRTTPGDTIYIWGFRPEVAYLADLRPATRFQAQFPLVGDYYPEAWKQENVDILWAAMPPYVLVMQADQMPWVTGSEDDSALLLTRYKPLEDWLIANYERQDTFGDFIVWKRRDL